MLSKKKLIFIIVITGAIVISASLVIKLALDYTRSTANQVNGRLNGPSFDALRPSGKKVAFEPLKSDQAFAYTDTIGNIEITVNQQPLPDGFKNNPDLISKTLPKNYSQSDPITVNTIKIYSGVSAQGDQKISFIKNGILVFITANHAIDNDSLVRYIKSLK